MGKSDADSVEVADAEQTIADLENGQTVRPGIIECFLHQP